MNFLAHLLFSGNQEDVIFGNFIGDAIKGRAHETYSEGIQKGILLHRFIDSYTDTHDYYLESKRKFYGIPESFWNYYRYPLRSYSMQAMENF